MCGELGLWIRGQDRTHEKNKNIQIVRYFLLLKGKF